ncbi:MAG: hypothetical protein A2Z88_03455 [Omnitrophica WOR_2 bacterium GWA2_47_8]|nr:MAG: hypothetical protein A2Z88_03455 [Omnitrophica WOR_2 bacterium GWA2_47_8]
MSSKKMLWILGIAMIAAAPAVLAQSVLGSPWIYFGVNTLIVWAIIFLIAKLIATDLTKSENTGVHIAIFAIASVISWNLVGGGGFIWNTGFFAPFFHMMFFVNTIFMTLVLFYGLHLFGMKMESPEGKVGMWVMSILVGGVISSGMGYYFWQAGTFKQLLDLLFGQYGILTMRESRLIIFVTATLLGFWLLQDLRILGQESPANKFINWGIPLIIASNIASDPNPISTTTLIWAAYIVAMVLLLKGIWAGGRGA